MRQAGARHAPLANESFCDLLECTLVRCGPCCQLLQPPSPTPVSHGQRCSVSLRLELTGQPQVFEHPVGCELGADEAERHAVAGPGGGSHKVEPLHAGVPVGRPVGEHGRGGRQQTGRQRSEDLRCTTTEQLARAATPSQSARPLRTAAKGKPCRPALSALPWATGVRLPPPPLPA